MAEDSSYTQSPFILYHHHTPSPRLPHAAYTTMHHWGGSDVCLGVECQGVDNHTLEVVCVLLARRAENDTGSGSFAQGSMSFQKMSLSSSFPSRWVLNSRSNFFRVISCWFSLSSVEVGTIKTSSWILVSLRVPLLYSYVYFSRVMQSTGHFQSLQVLLHSLGGQKLPSGILGIVPPNFTSICDGCAYQNSGSGLLSSKRLIFSTVSGSRKRLTIPQMMEMEVLMRTLQQAKSRERQISERKAKAFFMASTIWNSPWQPESISDTQFSTCPGMKQWWITYSRKQTCISSSSPSLGFSRRIFSTSNTRMGRQWQSRPIMQSTPSSSNRLTSRLGCSSRTPLMQPMNRCISVTHFSTSQPVDSMQRSLHALFHRGSSWMPLAWRCLSNRSSCSYQQGVQVSWAQPSKSSLRMRLPSPILKSSLIVGEAE